jgi:hypothetical protein
MAQHHRAAPLLRACQSGRFIHLVVMPPTRVARFCGLISIRYSRQHGMIGYHQTGVIDPEREIFIMIGYPRQFWVIDIGPHSTYAVRDWSKQVRGCEPLLNVPAPGLAFDTIQHVILGWAGDDSVYLFDPDRESCTDKSFPGGPSKAQPKGSYARFRYSPALKVFAIVNGWSQDAYALRLTEAAAAETNSIVQANSWAP